VKDNDMAEITTLKTLMGLFRELFMNQNRSKEKKNRLPCFHPAVCSETGFDLRTSPNACATSHDFHDGNED
jgi:hypothetical protein